MLLGKTQFQQAVTSAWSPSTNVKLIATGSLDGGGVGFEENEASLIVHKIDLASGTLLPVKERKVKDARFSSLSWGGEHDSTIAGGMTDGTVRLWNMDHADLSESGLIRAHDNIATVRSVKFNTVLKTQLVHGGSDKRVVVTDLSNPSGPVSTPVTESPTQHTGEVSSVDWNVETPHILASASMDGVCSVWDTRSKKSFCDIRDPRSSSTVAVCWSPKTGYHLVTGSDSGHVRLFDLRSSKTTPLAEFQAHASGVFDVSWCPQDPGYLASCGKDNKLIVWDLYTLKPLQEVSDTEMAQSPMYGGGQGFNFDKPGPALNFGGGAPAVSADALFSGSSTGADFDAGSGASSRRYQIHWSPSVPGVLTACSFDRTVQLLSLITNASANLQGQKVRSPPWVGRRGGVSFGFGGRLVTFSPALSVAEKGHTIPEVEIKNCHAATVSATTALRMAEFERSLAQATLHDAAPSHDHLAAFCAEQASRSQTASEQEVWKFMRVLFEEENPRVAVQKYLGYDEEAIAREVDLSVLPPDDVAGQGSAEVGPETTAFAPDDDAQEESPVDAMIERSLTVGNFEAAVALCLQHGRAADALVISSLGGPPLMKRAHKAYLESQSARRRVMRLAKSIFDDSTQGTVVRSTNLTRNGAWKQTLAFLMTYTRPEDFPAQCDALAQRLEYEAGDATAATICYMLSRNVEKSAELWTRLNPKDDVALVEKAVVFQKVLPNPQALNEDRVMMQRFTRLASKLADEGEFEIASKYASMAQNVDGDANELVQRIQYGLRWTLETETQAAEVERAAREAEEQAAQQLAMQEQQQAQMTNNGYYDAQYGATNGSYNQTGSYGGYRGYENIGGGSNSLYGNSMGMPQQGYAAPNFAQQQQQPQQASIYSQPQQQPSIYSQPAAPSVSYGAPSANIYSAPLQQPQTASFAPPQPAHFAPPPVAGPPPSMFTPSTTTIAPPPVAPPSQYTQQPVSAVHQTSGLPIPRVKENDGFGSTAGNRDAGAKYGNRLGSGAMASPPQQQQAQPVAQAPPKPAKVPDSMMPALQSIQRLLATLKAKYPSGLEERRLREAEKGEELLRAAIAIGSLSEFFLGKIRDMASAFDRGAIADAQNIYITLSSSVDWKEHKEWLKKLGHLIAIAQKDAQPAPAAPAPAGPASMPPPPSAGAYRGPPPSQPGPGPSYSQPPSHGGPSYGGNTMGGPVYPSPAGNAAGVAQSYFSQYQ